MAARLVGSERYTRYSLVVHKRFSDRLIRISDIAIFYFDNQDPVFVEAQLLVLHMIELAINDHGNDDQTDGYTELDNHQQAAKTISLNRNTSIKKRMWLRG